MCIGVHIGNPLGIEPVVNVAIKIRETPTLIARENHFNFSTVAAAVVASEAFETNVEGAQIKVT